MENITKLFSDPDSFLIFCTGVLGFQIYSMLIQFLHTKRMEYLWYAISVLCMIAIYYNRPEENFYFIFKSIENFGILLFCISNLSYWLFIYWFFEVSKSDRLIHGIIYSILIYYGVISMANVSAIYIDSLAYYVNHFSAVASVILIIFSIVLYVLLFLRKDKKLVLIVALGGLIYDFLLSFSIPEFFNLANNVENSKNGTILFLMSDLSESLFIAFALAYKNKKIQDKTIELEQKLNASKVSALRAQINPHFIYNCLNALNKFLLNNENDAANYYLIKFSKLIRNALNFSKNDLITLEEELDYCRKYIELEELRFRESFQYNFHIDPSIDLKNIQIPPLIIQPYLENAIHHGLHYKKDDRRLDLSVIQENKNLNIIIKDNGIGRIASTKMQEKNLIKDKSYGMNITKERMEILNILSKSTKIDVTIVDLYDDVGIGVGTEVRITLSGVG
jgi:sensor histidine kinase YesM